MTDYSAVKNELSVIAGYSSEELERYSSLIEGICDSLADRLLNPESSADKRFIHLAGVKCLYQLLLLNQSESPSSFSAGDISYTMSSAGIDSVRELYNQALFDCKALLEDASFSFKAV